MTSILLAIFHAAIGTGVDQNLLFAIAKVESSMRPDAVGSVGELGLFQLRPKYYAKKNPQLLFDPQHSAKVAAKVLKWKLERCKSMGNAAFVCYNRGVTGGLRLKSPRKTDYYRKVSDAVSKAKGLKPTSCQYTNQWRAMGLNRVGRKDVR